MGSPAGLLSLARRVRPFLARRASVRSRALATPWLVLLASVGCQQDSGMRAGRPPAPPETGGEALYVTVGIADVALRLDPGSGRVIARLPLDPRPGESDEPHGIAIDPAGTHWYATVAHGDPSVWKFELPEDRLVGRVRLGAAGAARIGIAAGGTHAFVADYDRARPGSDGEVMAVSLRDLQVVARRRVCAGPHQAESAAFSGRVAVACSLGDEIVLLDGPALQEMGRFPVDPAPGPAGAPRLKPLNLAWAPDGEVLYVSLHLADRIRAFAPDGRILGEAATGRAPAQIAISRDGRTLVAANRGDGTLSVMDVAVGGAAEAPASRPLLAERLRVPLGAVHPHGVAIDASGSNAWVTAEGTPARPGAVVAVDLRDGRIVWRTPVAGLPLGIAWVPEADRRGAP
ncbi:MAG: beta-propeller fold lactonase family protein [Gemmatimonadota bacterium]|nr:beta-propeller fold lactonase family protein [Gemmatimonadota bacterium]